MSGNTKQRVTTILGREYSLRYSFNDRREIERELGKTVWAAMLSGMFEDQLTLLRYGLAHAYQSITNDKVAKMLQDHADQGGDYDVVLRQAFWAAIDAGLIGPIKDPAKLRRALADPDVPDTDEEPTPGKEAAPAAVKGGSGF